MSVIVESSSPTFPIRPSGLFPIRNNLELWILQTVGRTPWTDDQPCHMAALPTQDNINTEEKRTDIHASSGIRTHDPSVWSDEDILCLRPHGHCDRHDRKLHCMCTELVNTFHVLSDKSFYIRTFLEYLAVMLYRHFSNIEPPQPSPYS
jgi:hypothetical protein